MTECRECEGAVLECVDKDGKVNKCPRCGDLTDEFGKKIIKARFVEDDILARDNDKYKKEQKKLRCSYPGCKRESEFNQMFELINEEGSSVVLGFCKYHHIIVVGGHFKAEMIREHKNLLGEKKDIDFKLIGPFQEVEIAEQVMAAREMMLNFKVTTKQKKHLNK